jgi:hypothetical protein
MHAFLYCKFECIYNCDFHPKYIINGSLQRIIIGEKSISDGNLFKTGSAQLFASLGQADKLTVYGIMVAFAFVFLAASNL